MPVCRATSASMTVVASKHKASKHKSAIDKPLNSSKMLHRNVSTQGIKRDQSTETYKGLSIDKGSNVIKVQKHIKACL